MAASLSVSVTFSFIPTGGAADQMSGSKSIVPAADPCHGGMISVGTSDETLNKGDVGTIGWVFLYMLETDAAKYIEFGADGTNYPWRLYGGDPPAVLRFNGTNVHAKASVASKLQYKIGSA